MEDGSLLQEALQFMSQQRNVGGGGDYLTIYAFLINDDGSSSSSSCEQMDLEAYYVRNAKITNDFFAECTLRDDYIWNDGSLNGPTFGFDVIDRNESQQHQFSSTKKPFGYERRNVNDDTNSTLNQKSDSLQAFPCLKSCFRYDNSIDDVWYIVGIILDLTRKISNIAFEVLEGPQREQVLLVEAANILPIWADNAGPDGCGHRVWLVQGKCCLIAPRTAYYNLNSSIGIEYDSEPTQSLELGNALDYLRHAISRDGVGKASVRSGFTTTKESTQLLIETPSAIQEAIQSKILKVDHIDRYHKAAVVLPREIACVFARDPRFTSQLVNAFRNSIHELGAKYSPDCIKPKSELVFTVIRFTKVSYITLTGCAEDYSVHEHFMDSRNFSDTMKACNDKNSSHLMRSIAVGACLYSGLHNLLTKTSALKRKQLQPESIKSEWNRLRILLNSTPTNGIPSCCQTFSEIDAGIIKVGIMSTISKSVDDFVAFPDEMNKFNFLLPTPNDVDSNDWLDISSNDFDDVMQNISNDEPNFDPNDFLVDSMRPNEPEMHEINEMMKGFESFLKGKSGVKGVENKIKTKTPISQNMDEVKIDTSKFLNILNGTFYDLRENDDDIFSDDDDDDDSSAGEGATNRDLLHIESSSDENDVYDIMRLMDEELKDTKVEHYHPEAGSESYRNQANIDMHVLTSLLDSLDVQGGESGPVSNILKEIGISLPHGSSVSSENLSNKD